MEDIIIKQVAKIAVQQVMKYLVSRLPIIGLGIINPLVSAIVSKIIIILLKQTELGIKFLAINIRTEHEKDEFKKAVEKQQQATTEEEKQKAEVDLIDAARKFIKL
jgi:hypothetical protein